MGIPGLFNQFIRNIKGVIWKNVPIFVSSLAFDLNGVFHEARNNVLGSNTTDKEVLDAIARTSPEQIELQIRIEILRIISNILEKIKPHDSLLLCVDGPAPQAKLQQQKIRRQSSIPNPKFDSNAITPGTEFMSRLHDDIIVFIERNRALLPPKVIYSSHLVKGEGEHKIMDYYRSKEINTGLAAKKGGSHFIYGLDSDLIMLSLLSPLKNIFLYQERPEFNVRSQQYRIQTYIVNINGIKNYLLKKRKNMIVINDFVVMCFLIGNDFLPHFPVFKDIGATLIEFVDIYFENNFTLTSIDEENDPSINWVGFEEFINILASQENKRLIKLARKNNSLEYPSRFIENSLKIDEDGDEVFSYKEYSDYWYNNALGCTRDLELLNNLKLIMDEDLFHIDTNDKVKMINNYLTIIAWNYLYYIKGTSAINMDLIYLYHHSPMLKDINTVLQQSNKLGLKISGYKSKDQTIEFTALHQLVAVLPLKSIDLIPVELKPLFYYDSILRDIFPEKFIIEMDGIEKESQKHNGLSIIPFVDRRRIYDAVFQINFDPDRAKLWLPHQDRKSERTETQEQKLARELAHSEYMNIREKVQAKKLDKENKNIKTDISFKEVAISEDNKLLLKHSDILSSFGIELGRNTTDNRFSSDQEISFIDNKITKTSELQKPNKLLPISNIPKKMQTVGRSGNEPISYNRNEPISYSRNSQKSDEKKINDPISYSRNSKKLEENKINEPISYSRNSQKLEEKKINEPISYSRNPQPEEKKTNEPISYSRNKPFSPKKEMIYQIKNKSVEQNDDKTIEPPKEDQDIKKITKISLLPVPTFKAPVKTPIKKAI